MYFQKRINFAFLLGLLIQNLVFGQQSTSPGMLFDNLKKSGAQQLKNAVPTETEPLEAAIDPEKYIVGPGDLFQINIWGAISEEHQVRISPENKMIIPNVGEISFKSLTLSHAKKEIEQAIVNRYRRAEISITLVGIRKFRVFVSGAVRNPGSIVVNANTRVSEVIQAVGGFKTPINVQKYSEQTLIETPSLEESVVKSSQTIQDDMARESPASKRNILLHRQDGQFINVDLLLSMEGGDHAANPYLLDGDVVFVPNLQTEIGQVAIWGAIRNPGEFEYRTGDNLHNLILLGHGFTIDADKSHMEIVRFEADHRSTRTIKINLADSTVDPKKISLFADDRIYIRRIPQYHTKAQVIVRGEVKYPGEYYIIDGQTTLAQVVEQAGGYTGQASLAEATLIRKSVEDVEDPEFERLKKMTVEEMTEQERNYFKIKSREKAGSLGIDFIRLFLLKDKSADVPLLDRDEINIPTVGRTIAVSGQVVRPGLITFVSGQTFRYYVEKAGGYSWNARKSHIRVIRSQTGEWLKPNGDTEIYLGDTIFVPERPERDYWALFKDFMQIAYQIATIGLVLNQALK
ncbi:SLBB domain-containing protein [candidate division KSB1 bacterium]|nr:SLBB domain-containing protein [candidate division KSB1 bacterium]